jgi:methyltransferase (TIGR00027 family)
MSESTKVDPNLRSVENQPSEPAMATATLRALAAHDSREEIRGADTFAEIFLTEDRKNPLKDITKRQWLMQNKIAPGAYEFMIARTAFFDQIVKDALVQNLPQIVFLGAGYDTRPYRFKDLMQGTRIFELDAPPTQFCKREVLKNNAIAMPHELKFVPIDFRQENLQKVLLDAGFSRDKPALFVWEGVTYYLSSDTVDETLSAVRELSSRGGSICLDYASLSTEAFSEEGARKLHEHLKTNHPGEPTKFGIPRGTLESFLGERGYGVIECLCSSDMDTKYLTLRDGTLVGKVPTLFSLVHAAVR